MLVALGAGVLVVLGVDDNAARPQPEGCGLVGADERHISGYGRVHSGRGRSLLWIASLSPTRGSGVVCACSWAQVGDRAQEV